MTVYEKIKEMSFDDMVHFLLIFANETIDRFACYMEPTEEVMREFLNRKKDEN